MKKTGLLLGVALAFTQINAQLRMPQPSPTQLIVQNFGVGKIEVTYSRPSLKGRTVFTRNSELAPVGQVWRTGANAATKIRLSDPVTFAGHALDSGTYALYTIPGEDEWTMIINRGSKNWGTEYHQEDDVMRVQVKTNKINDFRETFTLEFANLKPESCDLQLLWANSLVVVPITVNIKDQIRIQLETAMRSDKKPYFEAANYYFEYEKNYAKALENINYALTAPGNANAYWMYLLKAKIQKAAGDRKGARVTAELTERVATEQKNDDYARAAKELMKTL